MQKNSITAIISLVAAALLWASSFVAFKLAYRFCMPMEVVFFRMAIATAGFLVFYRKIFPVQIKRSEIKLLVFMAICEPCLYFLFEANALTLTTASQAGVIVSICPLVVAVAAAIFLHERLTARQVIGLFAAIAGAAWLSVMADPETNAPNPALGNLFEFLAMICAAGYMISLKKLSARHSPLFLTAFQSASGTIFFLPLYLLENGQKSFFPDPAGIAALIYLGIVVTMGAYGLYNFGLSRIPASRASAFINLIPVFTVILGWIILDERLNYHQYAAAGLIVFGVLFSRQAPTMHKRSLQPEEIAPLSKAL